MPALLKLAHWCSNANTQIQEKLYAIRQGRRCLPRAECHNQRVLLKQLWAVLPQPKQKEVLQTLSRLVTQGLEKLAGREEVRDEQHL